MDSPNRANTNAWMLGVGMIVLIAGGLAAIYLHGLHQTSSYKRNSAMQSEFRSLAAALEAYAGKERAYPAALWDLTTPVAYVAAIPADVYAPHRAGGPRPLYLYAPLRTADGTSYGWVLASCGPSQAYDIVPERDLPPGPALTAAEIAGRLNPLIYDATNGTNSRGAIIRIGGIKKK